MLVIVVGNNRIMYHSSSRDDVFFGGQVCFFIGNSTYDMRDPNTQFLQLSDNT